MSEGRSAKEVLERANALKGMYDYGSNNRWRVRSILNGGPEAIQALLGDKMGNLGNTDLPWANLIHSGITALAQKLGSVPESRVHPPGINDSQTARNKAEKIERIVNSYDEIDRMPLQMPQVARWLPGYGFAVWTVSARQSPDGFVYPAAQLRDPYDCYPGEWGTNQQPEELAVAYRIPPREAQRLYPQYAEQIGRVSYGQSRDSRGGLLLSQTGWANQLGRGLEVVEYYDATGTHIILPALDARVEYIPNMLPSPQFVVAKRFAFDHLIGQYDHGIGLMAAMAKFNVLYLQAMEDNVFAPTNIFGDFDGQYRIGRKAVNRFSPNTKVDRPQTNIPYQSAEWVNRIERDLRNVIRYPIQDDGNSPLNFATGAGLEELQANADAEVSEYRTVIAYALQDLDAKRLEWDEIVSADKKKPVAGGRRGSKAETYTPSKDIAGMYRTKREYGFMEGFDEPTKIVGGGQLITMGLVDRRTVQEKISGLDDLGLINERIHDDNMRNVLNQSLLQAASQNDPRALMLAAEALPEGDPIKKLAMKYFTPEEPEMSEEEQQLAGVGAGPGGGQGQGPPPDITTVLSQLNNSGQKGGIQTVSRV